MFSELQCLLFLLIIIVIVLYVKLIKSHDDYSKLINIINNMSLTPK
jgi:hypothetical protein